jgi:hypothetical protein
MCCVDQSTSIKYCSHCGSKINLNDMKKIKKEPIDDWKQSEQYDNGIT